MRSVQLFNFHSGVIMSQNTLVLYAPARHTDSPTLTHPHAMSVAAPDKSNIFQKTFTVTLNFNVESCRWQY